METFFSIAIICARKTQKRSNEKVFRGAKQQSNNKTICVFVCIPGASYPKMQFLYGKRREEWARANKLFLEFASFNAFSNAQLYNCLSKVHTENLLQLKQTNSIAQTVQFCWVPVCVRDIHLHELLP